MEEGCVVHITGLFSLLLDIKKGTKKELKKGGALTLVLKQQCSHWLAIWPSMFNIFFYHKKVEMVYCTWFNEYSNTSPVHVGFHIYHNC